ncbi:putative CXXCH cytochrome family protein [Thermodesulfitimonas autotrophica]|uniref:Putative CXXCH cytochrome family protein n=1 Tax=Thermodesulfitimonas autotrophica TaxID=1894989 RepID=A0A3N5AD61_9THEO|nr:cytochrome c3 family protein [Thermodesulfitimonas autotrophica]RPF42483.1 putative CXXCH cytochrome family protein [Thermodesulfitimonas autotrophica]
MCKAKATLILVAALACCLAFAAPAFAWTHGQFSATTDACAGCHVAHAAQALNLLKAGPTQTEFCFLCHGDGGTSAPYDVKNGYTEVTVGTDTYQYPSTGGGFDYQLTFTDSNDNGLFDLGEPTASAAITSRHTVWGYNHDDKNTAGSWAGESAKIFSVPGGTNTFTGSGFVCGSCHDPHDGGTTPDTNGYVKGSATSPNPRLLRRTITVGTATYSGLYVEFKLDTVGKFTYGNPSVDSGVYRVSEYIDGSTGWCGACHNKFNIVDADAGSTKDAWGMYRHGMDLRATLPSGSKGTIDVGTPLEKNYDYAGGSDPQVACLTCHKAHSTTATVAGWALSWPRSEGGTSTTSALLRMNNRGVCYNCHGAAQYNTNSTVANP